MENGTYYKKLPSKPWKVNDMYCYKIEVRTTNSSRDTFKDDSDNYYDCEDGIVFVVAESIVQATKRLTLAFLKAERIGVAYKESDGE